MSTCQANKYSSLSKPDFVFSFGKELAETSGDSQNVELSPA
jgi:hypothetical protein